MKLITFRRLAGRVDLDGFDVSHADGRHERGAFFFTMRRAASWGLWIVGRPAISRGKKYPEGDACSHLALADYFGSPRRDGVQHLVHHLGIGPTAANWHVKGMVRRIDGLQRRDLAQVRHYRCHEFRVRQRVANTQQHFASLQDWLIPETVVS